MRWFKRLTGKQEAPSRVSPPDGAEPAGPTPTPQSWLLELFDSHGLKSTTHDRWVLPRSELPAIRGTWHPGDKHGRLDVQVVVCDGVRIEESFAGVGAGDLGLVDALRCFTLNAFHVLLSALWSRHDATQVDAAGWTVGERCFSAFIGDMTLRSSTDRLPSIPASAMDRLEAAITGESLEGDLHWFRFYVGQVKGEFTFEALKDNEPWPLGELALASCGWASVDSFYSARLFMVLRAAAVGAQAPAA